METLTKAELNALLSDISDFDYEQKENSKLDENHNLIQTEKSTPIFKKEQNSIIKSNISNPNLRLLLDVTVELSVELGRANVEMKDLLKLGEGSILELNKSADDPVDILVNRKPIAKGEVIVIDETFGVRIIEVLSTTNQYDSFLN